MLLRGLLLSNAFITPLLGSVLVAGAVMYHQKGHLGQGRVEE